MFSSQRLTKKQKKGLAFRERKRKLDATDVPVRDLQDDEEDGALVKDLNDSNENTQVPPVKSHVSKDLEKQDGHAKKRKRDPSTEISDSQEKRKKTKSTPPDQHEEDKKANGGKQQRYILFLGNLKYTTTKEAILQHFALCDPPPEVRLLTPKSAKTTKTKGCAFLEFSHRNALQQALKLHQSDLEGRKINVELTAGGGGKSDARIKKVQDRNRELAEQRKKRTHKLGSKEGGAVDHSEASQKPQRHSTTSGVELIPDMKHTWSVPHEDDGKTHRGGVKHAKAGNGNRSSRRNLKALGTGVNAIPVG